MLDSWLLVETSVLPAVGIICMAIHAVVRERDRPKARDTGGDEEYFGYSSGDPGMLSISCHKVLSSIWPEGAEFFNRYRKKKRDPARN